MKKARIITAMLLIIALAMQAALPVYGEGTEETPAETEQVMSQTATVAGVNEAVSEFDQFCDTLTDEFSKEEQTIVDVSKFFEGSSVMDPDANMAAVGNAVQMPELKGIGTVPGVGRFSGVGDKEDSEGYKAKLTPTPTPKRTSTPKPKPTPTPTQKPTHAPTPTPTPASKECYFHTPDDVLDAFVYKLDMSKPVIVLAK